MATSFCHFCETTLQPGLARCHNCGYAVNSDPLDAPIVTDHQHKRPRIQKNRQGPPPLPAPPDHYSYLVRGRPGRQPATKAEQVQHTTIHVHQERRPFDHVLHLCLTVGTCGAWLPVWIFLWLIHRP